jgi:nicotinamide-nucleotide amidase
MLAEIITIGDEILIGQIIDTNSAWLGQQLSLLGIKVNKITSLSDQKSEILSGIESAIQNHQLVIITGGLGPTKDDITKHTLAAFFNTQLVLNQDVLQDVTDMFASFGRPVTEINRKQAEVPENCITLRNKRGTAPGMAWNLNDKLIFSLPGVPFEMKWLFENEAIPLIKSTFKLPSIVHQTILTQGIGESALADLIEAWENELPQNIKLAYLPSPGMVRLRLSAYGDNETSLQHQVKIEQDKLLPLIGVHHFGFNEDTLEGNVAKLFVTKKRTLAIAESCTGGNISHKITTVPGCSVFYKGGFVSYANEIKLDYLNVKPETINRYGAVSKEVVSEMLNGAHQFFKCDYIVAVSGIAGPDGGTEEKPVGLVWIGVLGPNYFNIKQFRFGNDRKLNIERASLTALNMLRLALLNE